ncbi:MAG: Ig-like domain-containing protein, partial [Anaerorhabdus sp.]
TQPSPSPTVEVKPTPQPTVSPKPTVAPTQTPVPTVEPTAAPQPTATPIPTSKWDGVSVDTAWYDDSKTSFTINKAEELAGLAKLVNDGNTFENKTIILKSNIDLANYEWKPIGRGEDTLFKGTFNGNNLIISNMSITKSIDDDSTIPVGLFSVISNGTIKNLSISGEINVSSTNFAGLIAGQITNSSIVSHTNTRGIIDAKNAGGIIGLSTSGSIIDSSTNNAVVKGTGNNVGGIVGQFIAAYQSTIKNCVNNAKITGADATGGIVGKMSQQDDTANVYAIENCINNGEISGGITVGGIAGTGHFSSYTPKVIEYNAIVNSINNGRIYSNVSTGKIVALGGIAGEYTGQVIQSTNNGEVINESISNNIGKGAAGGIIGRGRSNEDFVDGEYYGIVITECVNNGNVDGTWNNVVGFEGVTAEGSYIGISSSEVVINKFVEQDELRLIGLATNGGSYSLTINGTENQEIRNPLYIASKVITVNNCFVTELNNDYGNANREFVSSNKMYIDFYGENTEIKKYNNTTSEMTKLNIFSDSFFINEITGLYKLDSIDSAITINDQRLEFDTTYVGFGDYNFESISELDWDSMNSIVVNVKPTISSETNIRMYTMNFPQSIYEFSNNTTNVLKKTLNGQYKLIVELKNPNGTTTNYKIKLKKVGELPKANPGITGTFVNKRDNNQIIQIKYEEDKYKIAISDNNFVDLSLDSIGYNSDGSIKPETLNRYVGGFINNVYFVINEDNTIEITKKSNSYYEEVHVGDIYELKDMTPHITDASLKFQENENVVVDFSLDKSITMNNYDNSIDKTELTEIYNDLITGKTDDIQRAAAQKIGNDIVIAYYTFDDQGNKIPLLTGGKNPLVKFKAWDGYLNQKINDDYVQLKGITVEGITTYIGVNVPGNSSWRTSTNPSTGTPSVGWLDDVRGKQIGVDIIVISEGIIARESLKVDVPAYNETDFSLNKTDLQLSVNGTDKLTISRQGTNLPAKWSSSDSNVVTVDAEGNLKAIAPGTATISVRALGFGITKTTIVTVSSSDKNGLSLYENEGSIVDSLPVDNTQNDIEETKDLPIDEPKEEPALQPEEETDTTTDGDQEVV